MEIVASDEARRFIEERGGSVFVSIRTRACCRGRTVRTLEARTGARRGDGWKLAAREAGFDVLVPEALSRLPAMLELATRRFPKGVVAYWNGYCWVD